MSDIISEDNTTGVIPRAKFVLPKPPVGGNHPLVNEKNHQKLMDYLKPRIEQGARVRDDQIERYAAIDKAVSGWMKMSEKDKARLRKRAKTGIPQATLANLPITWVQLDDLCTYYTQTFAPGKAMFYHTGKPDETESANQMVMLMNNHSIYAGYYRHFYQSVWAMLKYNIGGIYNAWEQERGPKIQPDPDSILAQDEVIWAGNKIHALDMYNFICDPLVHPTMLYKDGEWGARIFIRSHYWFSQRALNGVYYNCQSLLDSEQENRTVRYYRHPPAEADFQGDESTASGWISKLSDSPGHYASGGYEFLEMHIRLNPVDFGLVPKSDAVSRNRYEVWRITIVNGTQICETTYMNNIHNHIPYYLGLVNDDGMGRNQKSTAEIMEPLQNLASHIMNIFIQTTRKKLFGLTVYDKSIVDFSKLADDEIAGRIPVEAAGHGKDLRQAIWRDETNLDTERALPALDTVMSLLNQFFPAQALPSQIAGIDRAVSNQVAAVQNGVNRRQQKTAMLLDSTCLRPMRFGMYYNILQYQADGEEMTDYRGRPVKVDLAKLRMTDLPFIIGMGLKAIDRQVIADRMQQVIFALIQNPQAAQRVDILRMIDYWTDMLDIEIDMTQFELQPEKVAVDANAAEGIPPGGEAAGGAGGTGVTPMTNPQNVTQAIYG